MKPVALFDFDNTLYHGFSYFDLLQKQTEEGLLRPHIVRTAHDAMEEYKSGTIEYEETVVRLLDIYAAGLKGKAYATIYDSTHEFYRNSTKVYDFTRKVFNLLRATHNICLVTGEPQFIAQSIADIYGFEDYYATEYQVADGTFTGSIVTYLASRYEKHTAINHLLQDHRAQGSFAFGDSEGDMEMLAAVEYPICINPTAGLRERASQHDWLCVEPGQVEAAVAGLLAKYPPDAA